MGSNLVCLIDREYMQQLQEEILEEYVESMDNRIKIREERELERVKNLVLSGRISLNQAPEIMTNHPIMMIEKHCKRFVVRRRVKRKMPKVHNLIHLYSADTSALQSQISINQIASHDEFLFPLQTNNLFEAVNDNKKNATSDLKNTIQTLITITDEYHESDENIFGADILTSAECDKLKFKNPFVRLFKKCKTVEDMFVLADEIIGILESNVQSQPKNHELSSLQSSIGSSATASNLSDINKTIAQNKD